jgi:hypothetical protein
MPEISRFFGIIIRMYFDDHGGGCMRIKPWQRSRPWSSYRMFPRIVAVRHAGDYRLELTFADGICRVLDLRDRILGRGGVFLPLADIEFFRQVQVDRDAGTVVWPNGVDFCPDVLYSIATGRPIRVDQVA